ncbi:MAG: tripartite tricarboxylate transporter TctB family protein [Aestuariivita sp.]|nr:tripartite tricarboxylate transporter TctB family protein [Aestuariivita sp.]
MANRMQDIVLGATLAVLAVIWTGLVIDTIPRGFGDGEIGARAFPLIFGIILLVLAVLLLGRLILNSEPDVRTEYDVSADAELPQPGGVKWMPAVLLLAEIALYGFLLEKIGFVLATPVIVLLIMLLNLRVRSIPKLASMSLGLTVSCWVIFEKLLGIYLANGTWINIG